MQVNIIDNLSSITKIPIKILEELLKKTILCIGSAVNDATISGETSIIEDIGIGTLSIDISLKQCKFIPNIELKDCIIKSIDTATDPLELELEQAIVDKLMHICDGIL